MLKSKPTVSDLRDLQRHDRPVGTAIHKAAHALAGDEFALVPYRATVTPSLPHYNGAVWFFFFRRPWHRMVVCLLAGPVAKTLFECGYTHRAGERLKRL